MCGRPPEAIAGATRQLEGEFQIGGQYHFYMETQTVRAVPREDDQLDIFSATQDMRDTHHTVAKVLKMPANKSVYTNDKLEALAFC